MGMYMNMYMYLVCIFDGIYSLFLAVYLMAFIQYAWSYVHLMEFIQNTW